MHTIQLPDDQFKKLTVIVQAAGYDDVRAFLDALTEEPTQDPLSPEELAESVAMIRRSEEDFKAGRYRDLEETMLEIAEKHGFPGKP